MTAAAKRLAPSPSTSRYDQRIAVVDGLRRAFEKFKHHREFTRRAAERERGGSSPDVVAQAVLEALTASKPKSRYPVGADVGKLMALARWVPDPLLDRIRLLALGRDRLAARPCRPG